MGTNTTPSDAELEKKRSAFRMSIATMQPALQELARAAGMSNASRAMDEPERFLDAVDRLLPRLAAKSPDPGQNVWLQARCAFLVGEVLRYRYGGTWFLQEDPTERFYLTPVVGGFDSDASVTVSPFGIVQQVLAAMSKTSLRQEMANLGMDNSDTAPQVDLGGMTGRHRGMTPKIRCTCGRALWDFVGGHGGKAAWMSIAHHQRFQDTICERIDAWLASRQDGDRAAFVHHLLGIGVDVNAVDDQSVIAALIARAAAADARTAFECSGCGRLWLEVGNDTFVPYSPDTGRRRVLEEQDEMTAPDTIRPPTGGE